MFKLICLAAAASAAGVGFGCRSGADEARAPQGSASVAAAAQTKREPLRGSITKINETWRCDGPVDLDYVSVDMLEQGGTKADVGAVLSPNCTGRIGYISIVTRWSDGMRLFAHDLVIEGGSIRCLGRNPNDHQDGIQSWQYAANVTLRNMDIRCYTANNSNFYLNTLAGKPRIHDVVCDHCFFGPNATSSTSWDNTTDSGIRDSLICAGKSASLSLRYGNPGNVRPIDEGNQVLRRAGNSDPRCTVPAGIVDKGSYEATNGDFDHDGTPESLDNCWGMKNVDQADADGDGRGDVCDS
jgi:hypothetical protein